MSSLSESTGTSSFVSDPKDTKGNLSRFHGEGAASSIEDAAAGYQSASMIAIGADTQSVSMLALLVNLMLSIFCLKAPKFIERIGLTKNGAIILSVLNSFTWITLFVVYLYYSHAVSPYVFGFLWLLNLLPGVLLSVQRDNWMSSLIPRDVMGSYLGRRMAIKSTFYLSSFFMLGILLDNTSSNTTVGFSMVFVVGIIASFIYFTIFTLMKDNISLKGTRLEDMDTNFGLWNFFKEIKTRKLSKFIIFTSLFGVSVSLCGPLYSVYMLNDLHFSYMYFTIILATEYLARIVSTPFWGRMADKYGNIHVLNIVSRVIPFVPICWLFWDAPAYFVLIQAISGLCWGGYDLCTQNYLFKMAPPEKKFRYIMYSKSLTLFCMAAGGILSVFLLREVFPLSGSRILSIFMISGLLRGIIAWYLIPKLVDFAVKPDSTREQPAISDELRVRIPISNAGLFYQPAIWRKYGDTQRRNEPDLVRETPVRVSGAGLFYRREAWSNYLSEMAVVPAPRTIDAPVLYPGIYHRAAAMKEAVPAMKSPAVSKQTVRRYPGQYKPQRIPAAA